MSIEKNIILSIDIGSTCTHLAAVDVSKLACVNRIDFLSAEFDDCFPSAVKTMLSAQPRIYKAKIASCVKDLAAKARNFCEAEKFPGGFESVKAHGGMPVMFKYENLQALGQDRVCNALACAALFGKQNCVIIDTGTAITIDYLRGGEMFEGGVILPGISMQFDALHRGTDALPAVNLDGDDLMSIALPATSTENCIKAGVLYGIAGAVDRCVSEYLRIYGNDGNTKIVATGGGWRAVMPFVGHEATAVPGLTLIGAAVYEGLGK
ncbi:MAG: type III pantothenate kinase [Chitinispirillales bacterium]|nr:type III pantothenate kinase [Chitinispirillales bacterium]